MHDDEMNTKTSKNTKNRKQGTRMAMSHDDSYGVSQHDDDDDDDNGDNDDDDDDNDDYDDDYDDEYDDDDLDDDGWC